VLEEAAIRFVLGGLLVSVFAAIGTILRPPSFAGMFGSAPSVAIATLTLAFASKGPAYAAIESRSMILGSLGLVAYGISCRWVLGRPKMPVWAGAAACWLTWLGVTFVLAVAVLDPS
jgi:hypothetical protein